MDIYLLRHGKAEERSPAVKGDAERKLTEGGRRELRCISKTVGKMGIEFDLVISSPLSRAKQTAQIILSNVKSKKRRIVLWDELKPESDEIAVLEKLSSLKQTRSVLLVGHEPLLGKLICLLVTSNNSNVAISLKKGGFAQVEINADVVPATGILKSMMTPRQLRRLCK